MSPDGNPFGLASATCTPPYSGSPEIAANGSFDSTRYAVLAWKHKIARSMIAHTTMPRALPPLSPGGEDVRAEVVDRKPGLQPDGLVVPVDELPGLLAGLPRVELRVARDRLRGLVVARRRRVARQDVEGEPLLDGLLHRVAVERPVPDLTARVRRERGAEHSERLVLRRRRGREVARVLHELPRVHPLLGRVVRPVPWAASASASPAAPDVSPPRPGCASSIPTANARPRRSPISFNTNGNFRSVVMIFLQPLWTPQVPRALRVPDRLADLSALLDRRLDLVVEHAAVGDDGDRSAAARAARARDRPPVGVRGVPRPGGRGRVETVRRPDRGAQEIPDDVIAEHRDEIAKVEAEGKKAAEKAAAEAPARAKKIDKKVDDLLAKHLTPEQRAGGRQLALQAGGMVAFRDDAVAEALMLTDAQKAAAKTAADGLQAEDMKLRAQIGRGPGDSESPLAAQVRGEDGRRATTRKAVAEFVKSLS